MGIDAFVVQVPLPGAAGAAAGLNTQAAAFVDALPTVVRRRLAMLNAPAPVAALMARSGGYDVEVTGPGRHHLVRVSVGLFDDAAGLVQVTGNLTPGQHVVVPAL